MMLIIKTRKPDKGPVNSKSRERELKNNKATAEKQYETFTLVFIANHTGTTPGPHL